MRRARPVPAPRPVRGSRQRLPDRGPNRRGRKRGDDGLQLQLRLEARRLGLARDRPPAVWDTYPDPAGDQNTVNAATEPATASPTSSWPSRPGRPHRRADQGCKAGSSCDSRWPLPSDLAPFYGGDVVRKTLISLIAVGLVAGGGLYGWNQFSQHYSLYWRSTRTGSMHQTSSWTWSVHQGKASTSVRCTALLVDGNAITHRLHKFTPAGLTITKGDNNPTADPWNVPKSAIVGQAVWDVYLNPLFGWEGAVLLVLILCLVATVGFWPKDRPSADASLVVREPTGSLRPCANGCGLQHCAVAGQRRDSRA